MEVSKSFKRVLLIELIVPIVLLMLGVWQGLMQTFHRSGIIKDTEFLGMEYYQGLTLHGVVNAIVLTTFFAVAFGNGVVRYYLKRPINDKVNTVSCALMLIGAVMAAFPILAGDSSVLFTFYPPLQAHPLFYIGATLLVIGSWVAFFNWIGPFNKWRKENPDKKSPMAVLGIFVTFIVWVLATIPLAVEIVGFLLPWSFGWIETVNVSLMRTLFWFFGHPLVYFWLLPSYVMFYVFLPKLAGGKLYSDAAGRLVFILFVLFSVPVGLHHQFAEPAIKQGFKIFHMILTFGVAIPSVLTAFTIAASLEYAGRKNGSKGLFGWMGKLPWFSANKFLVSYLLCGLIIFIFGGATGMVNASYNLNMVVHNTGWMPGHFHMTVAGPVFLAILGGTILMLSSLSGKKIKFPKLNVWVPYLWMIGLFMFSAGLMIGGLEGEPRRTNMGLSYLNSESEFYRPDWVATTALTAVGGSVMFLACLFYFVVFFGTVLGKKQSEGVLEFPTSEAYHDGKRIKLLDRLAPWTVVAVVIIAISYYQPIRDALEFSGDGSPRFSPDNPVPELVEDIPEPF